MKSYFKEKFNIAMYISSQDGIISEREFSEIKALLRLHVDCSEEEFDELTEEYFTSEKTLENYLSDFQGNLSESILGLRIAVKAAAADGLNIKENLSYLKALDILGLKNQDIVGDSK